MIKKIVGVSVLIIAMTLLSGCGSKATGIMSEYEIESDNFIETSLEEAVNLVENEEAVIYFGYSKCPWCLELVPILDEVSIETETKIYYVNVKPEDTDLRTMDNEAYSLLLDFFNEDLQTDENGEKKIYVPYVVKVANGEIKSSHIGTFEDHDANEREMTNSEKIQLKEILTDLIENEE